jgi:hypothetical protein
MALWLSPLLLEMEMELFISSLRTMPAFMKCSWLLGVCRPSLFFLEWRRRDGKTL